MALINGSRSAGVNVATNRDKRLAGFRRQFALVDEAGNASAERVCNLDRDIGCHAP